MAALAACNKDNQIVDPDPDPADISTVKVLDYSPMPGQFVNEQPAYEPGNTRADILAKVQQSLDRGYLVSLGAWGGSITLELTTPLQRPAVGTFGLRILGNAFVNGEIDGRSYGSAEPGIVQVMYDANANGRPDDEWYTIPPGSEYVADITVTYHRHKVGDDDDHYIRWEASDGRSGYINRYSAEHSHDLFPGWDTSTTLSATGIMLPDNGVYDSATRKYQLFAVPGTADSYPNTSAANVLDVATARNAAGTLYPYPAVNYVRVYTGVLQCNGPLGEVSTEIAGI